MTHEIHLKLKGGSAEFLNELSEEFGQPAEAILTIALGVVAMLHDNRSEFPAIILSEASDAGDYRLALDLVPRRALRKLNRPRRSSEHYLSSAAEVLPDPDPDAGPPHLRLI